MPTRTTMKCTLHSCNNRSTTDRVWLTQIASSKRQIICILVTGCVCVCVCVTAQFSFSFFLSCQILYNVCWKIEYTVTINSVYAHYMFYYDAHCTGNIDAFIFCKEYIETVSEFHTLKHLYIELGSPLQMADWRLEMKNTFPRRTLFFFFFLLSLLFGVNFQVLMMTTI